MAIAAIDRISGIRSPISQGSRCLATRKLSLDIAAPLSAEDQVVQAMDDASPTKWHLAHTTWFWETFVLTSYLRGYSVFDETFNYCFNSYYNAVGSRHPRAARGLLTRPSLDSVRAYRSHVDDALSRLFATGSPQNDVRLQELIEIGINHEQQHQELMLTDVLALFAAGPLRPAYREAIARPTSAVTPAGWIGYDGGIRRIGYDGDGFHFDCEGPAHDALIRPFRLMDRLVTNGEWRVFMADGGYERPDHWLSDGWDAVRRMGWSAPGYWELVDGGWHQMTLEGLQRIDDAAAVSHVSYYEADAYARWAGKRLPSEAEWELAARNVPVAGNMLSSGALRPMSATKADGGLRQMFGDVWEWTHSPFSPYPGYRAAPGAIGEYNGKFMSGQYVLRGSSCVTPEGHTRATYRNFFYPHQRWQFMGLRLAEDA